MEEGEQGDHVEVRGGRRRGEVMRRPGAGESKYHATIQAWGAATLIRIVG